jgi:hypothetical protein
MGRFSLVHIIPDVQDDPTQRVIPVKIVATHGGRGELRLGGGGGYDSIAPEVRVRAGISHIPRLLPLWTFGVDGRVALAFRDLVGENGTETEYEWRVRVLGTGRRIDLGIPKLTLDVGAGWDFLSFEAYTMTGPLGQLGLTYPLARWLQARVGWSMQLQFFPSKSEVLEDPATAEMYNIEKARRLASYRRSLRRTACTSIARRCRKSGPHCWRICESCSGNAGCAIHRSSAASPRRQEGTRCLAVSGRGLQASLHSTACSSSDERSARPIRSSKK